VSGISFGDKDMNGHGTWTVPTAENARTTRHWKTPVGHEMDLQHPFSSRSRYQISLTATDTILSLAVKNPRKERSFLFLKTIVYVGRNSRKGGLGILIFHYLNTSILYLLIAATQYAYDVKTNQKRRRTNLLQLLLLHPP
jgi:hypothetical protein